MADAVQTNVIFSGGRRYTVQLMNTSDGTGEAAVVKIDKSTLSNSAGLEPNMLALEEIQWNIQGFTNVDLFWDATTDDEMVSLNGNGYKDFREYGVLADPQSIGYTGDVVLTTDGAAAGDTYDILMSFKLKGDA